MKFDDDPKPWTVKSSKYLFEEPPWLTLREDHVVLPNGAEIERYWVSEYPTWTNAIAVTADERVVLVRQYRHGLGAVHFELPGGVVDSTPEECARRELLEETGYGGGAWSPFMTLSANPALQHNLTHTFLATDVEKIAEPTREPTEDLRVHLVPITQIGAIIDEGGMMQALHAAPLLRFLQRHD